MGTITKNNKTSSGTKDFADNTPARADELNADLDTIITVINGNLENVNIKAGAGIALSKIAAISPEDVDDQSDSDAEQITDQDPGTVGSQTNPEDLDEEIETLRYGIKRQTGVMGAVRYDGSANNAVNWLDYGVRGPNLVFNGNFLLDSDTTADAAPDGWTLVSTPTISTGAATDSEGLNAREVDITCATATAEGISQEVEGLKDSAYYLVVARVKVTTGDAELITTGGLASGEYQNITVPSTTTGSYETMAALVQADTSASDITIKIVGTTSATLDDFSIASVGMYEIGDETHAYPGSVAIYREVGEITGGSAGVNFLTSTTGPVYFTEADESTDLLVEVYIPTRNWKIRVDASINLEANQTGAVAAVEIHRSVDGGAYGRVAGPATVSPYIASGGLSDNASVQYLLVNPTPGLYSFKVSGDTNAASGGFDYNNTTANSQQAYSWLMLEADFLGR